jgi:CheY-like chemotaxis protein
MRVASKLLSEKRVGKHMPAEVVQGKRILLADDQQGVRSSIKLLLEVDSHSVVEARNGREALSRFTEGPFDLVITDYAMPEMTGKELAVNIKQSSPDQPILMITAYANELGEGRMAVDAVLHKPFSFQDLRVAIARLLGSGRII